jgi:starch synthase (maltosyl-transferring)
MSFPESHDTERLATELNCDRAAAKMRYAFAALFAAGVIMPSVLKLAFPDVRVS